MDQEIINKLLQKCEWEGECLVWTGCVTSKGYGNVRIKNRNFVVTRLMYEHYVGPIPEGYFILHSCDNPKCVSVQHLRPGTQMENLADAKARNRHPSWNKTHCKHGHELSGDNVRKYTYKGQERRSCKACDKDRWPDRAASRNAARTKAYHAKKNGGKIR